MVHFFPFSQRVFEQSERVESGSPCQSGESLRCTTALQHGGSHESNKLPRGLDHALSCRNTNVLLHRRCTLVGGELQQLWFSTTKFKVASCRHVRELVVKIRMNMRGRMQRAEKKTTLTFGPSVVLPCCASVTATVQSPRLRALIVRSHVSHPISLSPTKASAHSSGNCIAERLSLIKM